MASNGAGVCGEAYEERCAQGWGGNPGMRGAKSGSLDSGQPQGWGGWGRVWCMNRREEHEPPHDPVVGGVLVRLSKDAVLRDAARLALAAHPGITLGEPVGRWLTLALEAENASEGRDLHAWLCTVPGVEWVEVVSVHFEGPGAARDVRPAMELMP